jgi:TRAP-type C4-dicarboxylate transport system substrate-binding protein
MMRWALEAMGFSVQIMPLPEVYLAIQQGTVAGQENPIDTIYSNKFYEVAPYITLTLPPWPSDCFAGRVPR